MMYPLYMFGSLLSRILPTRAGYLLAKIIVGVYYLFAKNDKRNLRNNLRVVLGEGISERQLERHVWHVFKNFAKYLVDFFKLTGYSEEYINKNIELVGREHLDAALAQGRGVILAGLHLGNWELGGAIIGGLKYPVCAIALEHSDKKVNEFFAKRRARNNLRSIHIGSQIKGCFKALKNNEILGIVADKDYTGTGIPVDFFGRKALMPKGPAVIALKTGAPIIITVTTREKGDRFKTYFTPPIEYTPKGDLESDTRELMSIYLRQFEGIIRQYPDQWYVFGEIWDQG